MPGSVSFADWTFNWSIPSLSGGGLVITLARFRGTLVLWRASQPFVLVPYHGDSPTFKDGLNWQACGSGISYTAMRPTAPNAPNAPGVATNDNQWHPLFNPGGAVMVQQESASFVEPAHVVIWAKMQAANYQYVQRWAFHADGSIEAGVGLAGRLWTFNPPTMGHIHNFYFRLDFDIATPGNNLVQRFAHQGNDPGDDVWIDIKTEGKETVDPTRYTKWRIINKARKPNGQFRSYELVPASDGLPDGAFTSAKSFYSTGDLWVVRYKGGAEDGSTVTCNDSVLGSSFVSGESVDGQDVVVWYCLRHHHNPRQLGEETKVVPYEFHSFHIQPRDFLDATPVNLYSTTPPSPF